MSDTLQNPQLVAHSPEALSLLNLDVTDENETTIAEFMSGNEYVIS